MPKFAGTASIVALAALLSVSCAEHLILTSRDAVSGGPKLFFWPPPEPTSTWAGAPSTAPSRLLGEAAGRVAEALHSAGYGDLRWYAIGARYAHGFVVTTRLERVRDDGAAMAGQPRWSPRFAEASNLFWLEAARQMRLPGAGRYRVLLVAFTDLPIGATNRAQPRSEWTWLSERPEVPSTEVAPSRRVSAEYRVGAYVYEYRAEGADGEGAFVSYDGASPAGPRLDVPAVAALLGEQAELR